MDQQSISSSTMMGKKPKYPDPNLVDEYVTAAIQQRYDIDDEPSRGNEGDDEDDDDDDDDVVRNEVDDEDDDDDDDEVVVDEDPSSSLATGSGMINHGLADPIIGIIDHDFNQSLARQRISAIQSRMKNFETILTHLKCQLNNMHKHDNEMLKKVVTLNDEIAELNLLESYESSKLTSTTNSINNHHQTENFSDLVLAAAEYGHHQQHSHHHSIDSSSSSYHMMKNTNY